jgi:uncharacterized protein YndB with AHSA1/START domain
VNLEDVAVEVQVVLPAPPERVFALLTDVEAMGGLGPENVRSQWRDERRGVGAAFTGANRRGELAWEVPCLVVEHVPPSRFAFTTGDPERPSATWSYELAPVEGGTLVTQRFRHGPGDTALRRYVEQRPDRAEQAVARRIAELEQGMRTTLAAAARLL